MAQFPPPQPADTQPPLPPTQEDLRFDEDLSQVDKDLIFEGLKQLYKKKVLPLEISSKFSHFSSPPMGPSDFDAKPMVLILGQYSVGKTSFIRSLLQQDFPGQRIGPEPTTDRFTAIMQAPERQKARLLPGHALVMQTSKPFRGLASFGNNFLSKFEGAEVDAPILRNITIIDTPGVLAGEKQRLGRDYDFSEVIKWFAERADLIIVMFDAHKLDISDELKCVLDTLKPNQEKIRVLLNKADAVDTQALLRVYGALMWALGKVVGTPEVCKVYLGSFWDAPLRLEDNRAILEREKADLLQEMMTLPQNAVIRRINELVKRARSVKVHAYIIHYLKKQMPYVIGKSEKQKRLLGRLDKEFLACARRYNLPLGDFPPVEQYRKMLSEIKDISDFKKLDKNLVAEMDRVLTHDIPLLLQRATSTKASTPKSGNGLFQKPLQQLTSAMGQNGNGASGGSAGNQAVPTYQEYGGYDEYDVGEYAPQDQQPQPPSNRFYNR
ncbi:P-loop containing nucleoside triphosphate hydrolase protein [Ochromonadaceae sp. CCMP2298]|nr:P-loop containing nucleoside triphosphate hydrolase protein [Ochromonadaceae sp. CCMP2298]